jgi:hypothetical protein
MPDNILATLRDFFGMTSAEFAREYKLLTAEDKNQIKAGILDGTLTY